MKVGLNLFSIRSYIKTDQDFLSTAIKLKEGGYDYLQFSGAPFDSESIKRVSKKSGLKIYLTHVPIERIINDTQKLMDEHESFGCKNIGLGMMPIECFFNKDLLIEKVALLNEAGRQMAKRGFKLFYHHHHFEFIKLINNKTIMEYMLENAEYINFTLDTYWLQYGGADILAWIKKLSGRIECAHLKDYCISAKMENDNKPEIEPNFAPVGSGVLDFKRIIPALKKAGVKYFFVEQDDVDGYEDAFGQVLQSVTYIKSNF